jgi:hypothetical protein
MALIAKELPEGSSNSDNYYLTAVKSCKELQKKSAE